MFSPGISGSSFSDWLNGDTDFGFHFYLVYRVIPTDLEVVQLAPKYGLPAGTEIGPGVFVLSRPHWLITPLWVEMVTMIPAAELHSDEDDTDKEIVRKREMLRCLRAVRLPPPSHPDWPPGADLILVPDDIEVYSFGKAAPGFEALVRSTVRTVHAADTTVTSTSEKSGDLPGWLGLMPLPLAHFLVQRCAYIDDANYCTFIIIRIHYKLVCQSSPSQISDSPSSCRAEDGVRSFLRALS